MEHKIKCVTMLSAYILIRWLVIMVANKNVICPAISAQKSINLNAYACWRNNTWFGLSHCLVTCQSLSKKFNNGSLKKKAAYTHVAWVCQFMMALLSLQQAYSSRHGNFSARLTVCVSHAYHPRPRWMLTLGSCDPRHGWRSDFSFFVAPSEQKNSR